MENGCEMKRKLLSLPFSIIPDIVCEALSCFVSSTRVQTCICVNLMEKKLGIGLHRRSIENLLSEQWQPQISSIIPNYLNSILLLIFPTHCTHNFSYLIHIDLSLFTSYHVDAMIKNKKMNN